MDGVGGGGVRGRRFGVTGVLNPPPRFVRGGVLCGCLMDMKGVQRLFFSYYHH